MKHSVWSTDIICMEVNVLVFVGLPLWSKLRKNMSCDEYVSINTTLSDCNFLCYSATDKGYQTRTCGSQDKTTHFEL